MEGKKQLQGSKIVDKSKEKVTKSKTANTC